MNSRKIILLIFFISFLHVTAQKKVEINKLVEQYRTLTKKEQNDTLRYILNSAVKIDTAYSQAVFERMIDISNKYPTQVIPQAAILSRLYLAYFIPFSITEQLKIIKEAYRIAKQNELDNLLGFVEENLCDAYRKNMQYDSAMVSLLDAKAIYEKTGNKASFTAIVHRIGDLYYDAELWDKAEFYYKKVLERDGKYKDWRYVVIINNLGLIENHRKNYSKAEKFFNTSLNFIQTYKKSKLSNGDSIRLCYTYFELAKTKLYKKEYSSAIAMYEKSKTLREKTGWKENLVELLILKSDLLFAYARYDSSLIYIQRAEELNAKYGSAIILRDIYHSYSHIYEKLGDFKKALLWNKKYEVLNETLAKKIDGAAYLQIKAEMENETYQLKISKLERERYLFAGIGLVITFSLLVILVIVIKLRTADKKLINKNVEMIRIEDQFFSNAKETNLNCVDLEAELQKEDGSFSARVELKNQNFHFMQLLSNFEKVIRDEKLFLKPDLSLDEMVNKLGTNRTYLSKAINQIYHTNFSSFINDLRVKEAIRIISSEDATRLSIEGIGKSVGFNNRITFMSAFKKYTGVTPSFFTKNLSSSRKEEE